VVSVRLGGTGIFTMVSKVSVRRTRGEEVRIMDRFVCGTEKRLDRGVFP
jgi:hypothetical protein